MFDCKGLTEARELGIMLVEEAGKLPSTIENLWGMQIDLPLPIDLEVGPSWGHLEKLKL
jgi:hypothetical protein